MNNKLEPQTTLLEAIHSDVVSFITDIFGIHFAFIDPKGNYVVQNNSMQLMTQNKTNAKKSDKKMWEHCVATMKSGQRSIQEEQYKALHFLSIKQPVFDSQQNCLGIMVLQIDITARKTAEILRLAEKMTENTCQTQSLFLENIRHDIHTPLNGLIGFANTIREETTDHRIKEHINNLIISGQSLLDYLQDVFHAFQCCSQKPPIEQPIFDLRQKLWQIIHLHLAAAKAKGLKLLFEYDAAIPKFLKGDIKSTQRILLELLAHALTDTTTGTIKVKVLLNKPNLRNPMIKLIVIHSGCGMLSEQQKELLANKLLFPDTLSETDTSTKTGYAFVKQLIEDLHGKILFEKLPSLGSKVTCFIPFNEPLSSEIIERSSASAQGTTSWPNETLQWDHLKNSSQPLCKVLLVEDNAITAEIQKRLLSQCACLVDIANTGQDALKRLQKKSYDLVFMDVGLPDINGYEVTRRFRQSKHKHAPSTPIVALSVHVEINHMKQCIEAGMNAILTKPLTKQEMIETLDTFIPKRSARNNPVSQTAQDSLSQTKEKTPKGHVIDWSIPKEQGFPDQTILELLLLLEQNITADTPILKTAYQQKNWNTVNAIIHKFKGGALYCGATRLKSAIEELEHELLIDPQRPAFLAAYRVLLKELATLQKAIKKKQS